MSASLPRMGLGESRKIFEEQSSKKTAVCYLARGRVPWEPSLGQGGVCDGASVLCRIVVGCSSRVTSSASGGPSRQR